MRVVSWNVHRCFGTDGVYSPERVADALALLEADIIGLQEVDSSLRASDGRDQLTFIAERLGMSSEMGPTLARDYGVYGNAVLTRHKIVSREEHDLSYRKFEPRGALSVLVETSRGPVRVVNTHLGLKYWERSFQIDRVLSELVWRDDTMTILMGDFNEWFPLTGNTQRLRRAFKSYPKQATFPSPWPQFSLDKIFFSKEPDAVSYRVARAPLSRVASDHLALIAELQWGENGSTADVNPMSSSDHRA